MKLDSIKLKNFRGYEQETFISISSLTAFIGRNDAGKSTVLEALEIFFNNSLIKCEREDLNVNSTERKIEISCIFNDLPATLVIDSANETTLGSEHLLNGEKKLEIKKVFSATTANPKEKIYIVCNHPTAENANDLLTLKRAELKTRVKNLKIPDSEYNATVNASMRSAIKNHVQDLKLQDIELLVDKEDTKKIYEEIKKYLPLYALFQSDRASKEEDKEVSDPMKIAVQQALEGLSKEIDAIKDRVRIKAIETAERTLEKLREMSPELAEELVPEFKSEPKLDSQFKLTIKSGNDISINKRGSGFRRLILLNFFRAEAERRRSGSQGGQVIYAFEEPETSQHPDHQKMLIDAFIEIASSPSSQVVLTTHTPGLAGLLPLESLRFVRDLDKVKSVEMGSDKVYRDIVATLGLLAEPISKSTEAILLVEGKSDVIFVNHTSKMLKNGEYTSHTLAEKNVAVVPIGGCGNLMHWTTMRLAEQFSIPYCVLVDSDKGTNEEKNNTSQVEKLREKGIKAYLTRKREPENYLHLDCLDLPEDKALTIEDTSDAKSLIASATSTSKKHVLEKFWVKMTGEQIREKEKYQDQGIDKYEFTDMFKDFMMLVE